MFANECLGHLAYEAIAPAIAMAALMVIFSIDFIAIRILGNKRAVTAGAMRASSPTSSGEGSDSPDVKGGAGHSKDSEAFGSHGHDHDFSSIDASVLVASEGSARARFEVTLLEAGICFHSIMIGEHLPCGLCTKMC
jgi:zinc transporter 1/2/3